MISIKQMLQEKAKNLNFNPEKHLYTLNGKEFISCTTLIKYYCPKFDIDGSVTARCALKNGLTPRQQADLWEAQGKTAREKGSKTHLIAQEMLEDRHKPEVSQNRLETVLKPVVEDIKPYLIASEQIVYNEDLLIAGTIDVLTLYNGKLDLWDWKTNKDEITPDYKAYETMLPPLQSLPHNRYYEYALQLSLYRYLLELEGFDMGELGLIHIRTKEGVKEISLPNLRYEVILMLNDYKKKQEKLMITLSPTTKVV